MTEYRVEAGEAKSAKCDCCGHESRSATGFVYAGENALAAYVLHWTVDRAEHDANVDVIVGPWGGCGSEKDRQAVSLVFRRGGGFMVIDATKRPFATAEVAGQALTREQVIGTPLADQVFEIVDAIWESDARVPELVGEEA